MIRKICALTAMLAIAGCSSGEKEDPLPGRSTYFTDDSKMGHLYLEASDGPVDTGLCGRAGGTDIKYREYEILEVIDQGVGTYKHPTTGKKHLGITYYTESGILEVRHVCGFDI